MKTLHTTNKKVSKFLKPVKRKEGSVGKEILLQCSDVNSSLSLIVAYHTSGKQRDPHHTRGQDTVSLFFKNLRQTRGN